MINYWLNKLKNNPHHHDKIEFEIATTIFTPSIDRELDLMQDTLSKNEKIKFKNSLLSLTNNIILGKSVSIDNEINNIDQLEIFQKIFLNIRHLI